MATSVESWEIFPSHFWIHGKRPENVVEYDEHLKMWNVFGFPEAVQILNDTTIFSNDSGRLDPIKIDEEIMAGDFAAMDPPKHTKVRGLVDHAFKPRLVAQLQEQVHTLINELLDKVADQEKFDLVQAFTIPLPVTVISELLGVPASDRDQIHDWMHRLLDDAGDFEPFEEPTGEAEERQQAELEKALNLLREMREYWAGHAIDRRKNPRDDLLTQLVQAELDGERLRDTEVANIANRLLIAGHHSTSILIGNAVLCMDAFPEQAAKVRADPSLTPGMIEETMRYLSPISGIMRCTNGESEVAGVTIPADQILMVWTGAANRDPRQYDDPYTYDIMRRPNAHLGFGRGSHFCLGRPLARMEARSALEILFTRFPALQVDPDDKPEFYQIADATGVCRLPLRNG